MDYADLFFDSDGLRLHAKDYPGPDATAPAVLCLASLTGNSKEFSSLATKLCRRYRVICPDQRGRGRSARDDEPNNYGLPIYTNDMLALMRVLGIARVGIIGVSLGALIAMRMASLADGLVERAVLVDGGPELEAAGIERLAGFVGREAQEVATWDDAAMYLKRLHEASFPDYSPEDWARAARNSFVQDGTSVVADYDAAIASAVAPGSPALADRWPLFDAVAKAPLLLVRGEHSDVLSPVTFRKMAARAPVVRSATISGRGHAPTLSEPDAWAALDAFLRETDAA